MTGQDVHRVKMRMKIDGEMLLDELSKSTRGLEGAEVDGFFRSISRSGLALAALGRFWASQLLFTGLSRRRYTRYI